MFNRSKLESLHDVSVTRIGDAFSDGFPQTACIETHSNCGSFFLLKEDQFQSTTQTNYKSEATEKLSKTLLVFPQTRIEAFRNIPDFLDICK